MTTRLLDLVIDLATDPHKLTEIKAKPDSINQVGLTGHQKAALLSGDPEQIRLCIYQELGIKDPYPFMAAKFVVNTEPPSTQ